MCIIYFFSGIAKSAGVGWWNGTSLWRGLTRPPFNVIPMGVLIDSKNILSALGTLVCIAEVGYPFFILAKKSRRVLVGFIIGMHLFIGIAMGMYLFALIMIVLNMAAFGAGLIGAKNLALEREAVDSRRWPESL